MSKIDVVEGLRSWANWFVSCNGGNVSDEAALVIRAADHIENLHSIGSDLIVALKDEDWMEQDALMLLSELESALLKARFPIPQYPRHTGR